MDNNNEGFLVYSRSKISQIASCLGQIEIKGVANVKNMSVVLALLEMPDKALKSNAFDDIETAETANENE